MDARVIRPNCLAQESALTQIRKKVYAAIRDIPSDQDNYEAVARRISHNLVDNEVRRLAGADSQHSYTDLSVFVRDNLFGLGGLEPLLRDSAITDIMVADARVIVISGANRTIVDDVFSDVGELKQLIDRITNRVGRRVDALTPYCDCHLYDGSRCHIIIPPAADKHYVTIRKLGSMDLSLNDWVAKGIIESSDAEFLSQAVSSGKNILISGGTGAGKTTLLNTLANLIPASQIVVTLEDTYELRLRRKCVRRLLTRGPNTEGRGEIRFQSLLKNALRMNPDRILMGEVRDGAAYDLLQALNTGHQGSISTIHANSARDALWRLETLAMMGSSEIPLRILKREISRVIDVVVQLRGIETGAEGIRDRRLVEIVTLRGDLGTDGEYLVDTLDSKERANVPT